MTCTEGVSSVRDPPLYLLRTEILFARFGAYVSFRPATVMARLVLTKSIVGNSPSIRRCTCTLTNAMHGFILAGLVGTTRGRSVNFHFTSVLPKRFLGNSRTSRGVEGSSGALAMAMMTNTTRIMMTDCGVAMVRQCDGENRTVRSTWIEWMTRSSVTRVVIWLVTGTPKTQHTLRAAENGSSLRTVISDRMRPPVIVPIIFFHTRTRSFPFPRHLDHQMRWALGRGGGCSSGDEIRSMDDVCGGWNSGWNSG
mmetsp:Transcript_31492/g.57183  ORF Transcript_31492/g.57183 Transcript_31492/m.57183 type:complete len:253 (+) Transcript_31492:1184-1942(+)